MFRWILLPFTSSVQRSLATPADGRVMWSLGELRLKRPRHMRWRPLATLELSSIGYAMLGLFIAAIWGAVGPFAVLLVLLPLFIARWAFDQYVFQQRAHEATLATLCQAVETKDYYTRGHCMRVAKAAAMIAEELGMSAERVQTMRYAGMLHDIGKLGVPTKILQRPETHRGGVRGVNCPMRGYGSCADRLLDRGSPASCTTANARRRRLPQRPGGRDIPRRPDWSQWPTSSTV